MSICKELQDDNSLEDILRHHYQERISLIDQLGFISATEVIQYPNLEFISNFGRYIHIGNTGDLDDCLCNPNGPIQIGQIFGQGKIGSAYRIVHNNKDYILKIINDVRYQSYLSVVIHNINDINPSHFYAESSLEYNMIRDVSGSLNIVAIESDQFQNQTLINMILPHILGDGYVEQLDAFYCRNDGRIDGYNIMEIANLGDISTLLEMYRHNNYPITEDFIFQMIKEVLEPLSILKAPQYGFCHNDLKTRNIFVSGNLLNPRFKIADFDKSSIFWNGIRFANTLRPHSVLMARGLNLYYNGYEVENGRYSLRQEQVLGENSAFIMYSWIPMFMSHDVYTFIVSLLLEPVFWQIFSQGLQENTDSNPNRRDIIDNTPHITMGATFLFPRIYDILTILFEEQTSNLLLQISHMHLEYLAANTKEKKRLLRTFYSMNTINNILSGYKLKINIDAIYDMFELNITNEQRRIRPSMHISNDRHICVTPCDSHRCQTNTYSSRGLFGVNLYTSDRC